MGFPAIVDRVKALANTYGDNGKVKIYVEDVGFQKALVQALRDQGHDAEGVRPHGDKRARLALISHLIKNGVVRFAPRGNEEISMQVVNFGSETYMDLADALSMIVPEIVNSKQGYHPFPNLFPKIKKIKGEDYDDDENILDKIF
jgi:predicted phage terminase large subunit-like protein